MGAKGERMARESRGTERMQEVLSESREARERLPAKAVPLGEAAAIERIGAGSMAVRLGGRRHGRGVWEAAASWQRTWR